MIKSPSPRPAELHSSQVTSAAQKRSANQTAKVSSDSPKCPFWLPNVLMSLHVDPATAKRKRPSLPDLANCLALPWLSDTMQNRTRHCVHTLLTDTYNHLLFYLLSFDSRLRTAADRLMNTDHVRKFNLASHWSQAMFHVLQICLCLLFLCSF